MKEHEKQLNEAIRIGRISSASERPLLFGRRMGTEEYVELIKFTHALGSAMFQSQDKRETPLTHEELSNMCLSSAKWSLENYTTMKPSQRGGI